MSKLYITNKDNEMMSCLTCMHFSSCQYKKVNKFYILEKNARDYKSLYMLKELKDLRFELYALACPSFTDVFGYSEMIDQIIEDFELNHIASLREKDVR